MAFIPVSDHCMVTMLYKSGDNTFAQNRYFVASSAAPGVEELEEITDVFNTWDAELGNNLYTANWSLVSITARDMNTEEGSVFIDTDSLPHAGENPGGATPFQVSATVTWLTGLVGRSARGRTYQIGVPIEAALHNVLTSGYRASMAAAYDALRTGLEGAGHALAVVSFIEDGVPRVTGRALPVIGQQVPFPLATQRRRLR